jgi:hypothetical protein
MQHPNHFRAGCVMSDYLSLKNKGFQRQVNESAAQESL